MKKIFVIVGTRPEAIKLIPLYLAAKDKFSDSIDIKLISTGQHRHMLDQVLQIFNLTPDFELNVMKDNQSLSGITSEIVSNLSQVVEKEKPDWVVVQGDTTTAFAAALTAFYCKIKVAHVEAGLRTFDKNEPFPEEINRRLIGQLADVHFIPTEQARVNLVNENILNSSIYYTGNTGVDCLVRAIHIVSKSETPSIIYIHRLLQRFITLRRWVLITGHRRENFGLGFQQICEVIRDMATTHKDTAWIYPVHLNPNVREPVHRMLGQIDNVALIEPVDYLQFVWLMMKCDVILTDSGGVQEEAPTLKKPILVMRNKTERPEGVQLGFAKLVGTDKQKIKSEINSIFDGKWLIPDGPNPYGDGMASHRIMNHLIQF